MRDSAANTHRRSMHTLKRCKFNFFIFYNSSSSISAAANVMGMFVVIVGK